MNGTMMDYEMTIDLILEHANRIYPHKRVITKLPDGSFHRYTYADMYKRVKRLSKALVKLGVEPGDRIGTFGWNNYQHLELYFAIPCAGAVCHTLNIRLIHQLGLITSDADDKVIFIDAELLPLFESVADDITSARQYVLYNAPHDIETKLENVLFYEDLIENSDEDFEWRSTDERMAMGMCYTSGTTGKPKGVMYSHRSTFLHTMGILQNNSMGISESDVVLPVVPQFHAMAWGLPYGCVGAGAELVMAGHFLQGKPLADMLESEKVTFAAGIPTIWNALYQELKSTPRDISALQKMLVGGSAMPRSLTKAYEGELGVEVVHAWGMTETNPLGTICNLNSQHTDLSDEEKWDIKAGQGYPVLGVQVRIVDEEGSELPWDGKQMGEFQVRGLWIVNHYFGREVDESSMTADGWFRTGDVAVIGPGGYIRLTDRTKDLVKSGGEWISSVELESEIMGHANVLEAAVISIPDEKWSERPLALVVRTEDGEDLTEDDIKSHLRDKVTKFWIPDQIVFIDEVPKTSVGKFDKVRLRSIYAEGGISALG